LAIEVDRTNQKLVILLTLICLPACLPGFVFASRRENTTATYGLRKSTQSSCEQYLLS
jgi:hypothetical protein